MKKAPSGALSPATRGKTATGPVEQKVLANRGNDDNVHDKHVAAAMKAAGKPAGAAGKQFKYPIKMC